MRAVFFSYIVLIIVESAEEIHKEVIHLVKDHIRLQYTDSRYCVKQELCVFLMSLLFGGVLLPCV
jgi:hypothetical protein